MQWVERVGLVFDFLSFWLVAPEILGEERLKSAEESLERWLDGLPWALFGLGRLVGPAVLLATVLIFGLSLLGLVPWGDRAPQSAAVRLFVLAYFAMLMFGLHVLRVLSWEWLGPGGRSEARLGGSASDAVDSYFAVTAVVLCLMVAVIAWWTERDSWIVAVCLGWGFFYGSEAVLGFRRVRRGVVWVIYEALVLAWLVATAGLGWSGRLGSPVVVVWVLWLGFYALAALYVSWVFARVVSLELLPILRDDAHLRRRLLVVGAVLFVIGFVLQLVGTF